MVLTYPAEAAISVNFWTPLATQSDCGLTSQPPSTAHLASPQAAAEVRHPQRVNLKTWGLSRSPDVSRARTAAAGGLSRRAAGMCVFRGKPDRSRSHPGPEGLIPRETDGVRVDVPSPVARSGRGSAEPWRAWLNHPLWESCGVAQRALPDDAPNILIVLIDDVGPGLPTTFGGEIRTDTLTPIYSEGIGYNRFHTTAMCSPTRASLLTGRNHHRIGNGQIAELANDWDGYSGEIPRSSARVAEVLRLYGYATAAWGKWHNRRKP